MAKAHIAFGPVFSVVHFSRFLVFCVVFCGSLFVLLCFLAHLAKGNVSFCHPLVSVVCRPLTFIVQSETIFACGGHVC
jgi:hypothetical protein